MPYYNKKDFYNIFIYNYINTILQPATKKNEIQKYYYLFVKVSSESFKLKSVKLYPWRLKARIAFGPNQTFPSILGVK